MPRVHSFALVLVLFLMAMMAAGGAALGMMASTESLLCRYAASDLDHGLAVDSMIKLLPDLLPHAKEEPHATNQGQAKRLELSVGQVEVTCLIRADSAKTSVIDGPADAAAATLRQIAQENGMNPEHIQPRPIVAGAAGEKTQVHDFVWFDQVIDQQDFEEILPWTIPEPGHLDNPPRKTWSDLITFWGNDALCLFVRTSLSSDVRHWFIVLQLTDGKPKVQFRGRV